MCGSPPHRIFWSARIAEQGAEPVAELGTAGIEEALDGIRALGSTRRLVQNRDALTENLKPSGASLAHLRKLSGFCEP